MEINSRCAVLRALKKKRVTYDVARRFQQQLLNAAGLAARPVSLQNAAETQPRGRFFSQPEVSVGMETATTVIQHSLASHGHSPLPHESSADSDSASSSPAEPSNMRYGGGGARGWGTGRAVSTAARAAKVAAMTGQSEEQRIAVAVQGWLMSPSAKEGRARSRFVEAKFPALLQSTLRALASAAQPGSKSAMRFAAKIPQYRPGRVTDAKQAQKKQRHKGATLDELQSSQLLAMDSLYGGEVRFIGGAGGVGNAPSTLHSVQQGVVLGASIGRGSRDSPSTRAGSGIRVLSNDERMLSWSSSGGVEAPPAPLAGAKGEGGGEVLRPTVPPLHRGQSGPRRRRRSMSMTDLPPPSKSGGGGIFSRVRGLFRRQTKAAGTQVLEPPVQAPKAGSGDAAHGTRVHSGSGAVQAGPSFRELITNAGPLQSDDAEDSEEYDSEQEGQDEAEQLEGIEEHSEGLDSDEAVPDDAVAAALDGIEEATGGVTGCDGGAGAPNAAASVTDSENTERTHSTLGSLHGEAIDRQSTTPRPRRRSAAGGGGTSPATAPAGGTAASPADDGRLRSRSMAAFDWIKNRAGNAGSGSSKGQGSWGSLMSAPETPDGSATGGAGGVIRRSIVSLQGRATHEDDDFVDGLVAAATPASSGGGAGGGTPSTGSGLAAWSRARTRVLAVVRLAGSEDAGASPGSSAINEAGTSGTGSGSGSGSRNHTTSSVTGSSLPCVPREKSPSASAGATAAEAKRAEWRRTVFASPAVASASRRSFHGGGSLRRTPSSGGKGGLLSTPLPPPQDAPRDPRQYCSPGTRQVTPKHQLSMNTEGGDRYPTQGHDSDEPPPSPTLSPPPIGPGITRSRSLDAGRSPRRIAGTTSAGPRAMGAAAAATVAPAAQPPLSLGDIVGFAVADDPDADASSEGSEGGPEPDAPVPATPTPPHQEATRLGQGEGAALAAPPIQPKPRRPLQTHLGAKATLPPPRCLALRLTPLLQRPALRTALGAGPATPPSPPSPPSVRQPQACRQTTPASLCGGSWMGCTTTSCEIGKLSCRHCRLSFRTSRTTRGGSL